MIGIALIGCTGSIGRQTLDVVRRDPEKFHITALACGSDAESLSMLKREFSPRIAYCASDGEIPYSDLFEGCDVAFIAAGGFEGLRYTMSAIEAGKKILLANKESLVCGGELVMRAAKEQGVEIVPVDSEHSAIFQALGFDRHAKFEKLILTASGGPFLHYNREQLACATAKEALAHPTWKMGPKVTVDSATLLNKGYEVIEAKWLYDTDFEKIEAIVHPESIVHSLVCFADGAAIAQLGYPDMRLPIRLALTYPERLPCTPQLDLTELGALHFLPLPREKFPCFDLALSAGKAGGTVPTVLNGAAETAVRAFLEGHISFPQIAETIGDVLGRIPREEAESLSALQEADAQARRAARALIYGK